MSTTTTVLAAYPARYFAAWNDQEIEAVAPILAESFAWTDPLLPPEGLTNLEGAHGFFVGSWGAFPDMRFELLGEPLVDEAAGRVAQEWRMTGTHTGEFPPLPITGKPFDVKGTDVFSVDADGRATEIRAYYDSAGLMRQLGLA